MGFQDRRGGKAEFSRHNYRCGKKGFEKMEEEKEGGQLFAPPSLLMNQKERLSPDKEGIFEESFGE